MPTAWEVDTAVYEDKSKYVGDEDGAPRDVIFSADGTKMYMSGDSNNKVFQYTLSTPWDVLTAVYASKFKAIAEDGYPYGVFFSSDGSKMYIAGGQHTYIYQYTLETPWDVSSAVYAEKSVYVPDAWSPAGVFFRQDGVKMYVVSYFNDKVHQYTLSTPWDVSTATYDSKYKSVGSEDGTARDVFFNSDGTKMYIVGKDNVKIFQYTLSTPWDVSSAAYEDKYKAIGETAYPTGMAFKVDGTKMYVICFTNDRVYQYDLPVVAEGQPFALRRRGRYIGGVIR